MLQFLLFCAFSGTVDVVSCVFLSFDKVALVFHCCFVVVSANFSSCQVVFVVLKLCSCVFSFSFDDVFFSFGEVVLDRFMP